MKLSQLTVTCPLVVTLFCTRAALGAGELKPDVRALDYGSLALVYPTEDIKGAPQALATPASAVASTPLGMEVKESATELKISLLGDILFDYDKADIRPAAEPSLMHIAQMIQARKSARVLIEGHTDSKGSESYNAKLSERRAAAVKTWFVTKGVVAQNVITRGLGSTRPVASNANPNGTDNPEGRQKNRRVEITIKK